MSLPSQLQCFDKNNNCIAYGFINVGWFLNSNSLTCAILETFNDIKKIEINDDYYSKNENWLNDLFYIKAYTYTIPRNIIKHILIENNKISIALVNFCIWYKDSKIGTDEELLDLYTDEFHFELNKKYEQETLIQC